MTRATVLKDNENANARSSRITTRSKPPSSAATGVSTRPSVLADPAAQKRKREALGEVTGKSVNNRIRNVPSEVKGKGKETTDALVKPVKPSSNSTSTTTTTSRVPLRTVTSRTAKGNVVQSKTQKLETIVVERPKLAAKPTTKTAPRLVPVVEIPVPTQVTKRSVKSSAPALTLAPAQQPTVRKTVHRRAPASRIEVEIDEEPASKRRKTSSEIGDEIIDVGDRALLENIVEESEPVGPEVEDDVAPEPVQERPAELVQDWDDLDRGDWEDPSMVSEYANDIFNYFKYLEVRLPFFTNSRVF